MATIKPHGNSWRAQVYVQGQRRSKVLPSRLLAKDWARETEASLRQAAQNGDVNDIPLPDLLKEYEMRVSKHKPSRQWESNRFKAWNATNLGDLTSDGADVSDVQSYIDERLATVQGSTVNRELNLLSNVFTMAQKWKYRARDKGNPVSEAVRPKDNPPRDRRISQDEIDRICYAAGFEGVAPRSVRQRVACAFLFAIETAMRAGEICRLRPDHVTGRVAHLPKTKNGHKRDVPLSKRSLELLELVGHDFELNESQVGSGFSAIRTLAGLDDADLHFHDTRHEAISRLAHKMPVLSLARMTGHRDLRKLMIYYNESAEDLASLLD